MLRTCSIGTLALGYCRLEQMMEIRAERARFHSKTIHRVEKVLSVINVSLALIVNCYFKSFTKNLSSTNCSASTLILSSNEHFNLIQC